MMLSIYSRRRLFLKFRPSGIMKYNNKIDYSEKAEKIDQKLSETTEIQNIAKSRNLFETWSKKQMPKSLAMRGARFETVNIEKQPSPTPAIELISKVPVIELHENIVACDGGGGKLGHPKIYINLVRIFRLE